MGKPSSLELADADPAGAVRDLKSWYPTPQEWGNRNPDLLGERPTRFEIDNLPNKNSPNTFSHSCFKICNTGISSIYLHQQLALRDSETPGFAVIRDLRPALRVNYTNYWNNAPGYTLIVCFNLPNTELYNNNLSDI